MSPCSRATPAVSIIYFSDRKVTRPPKRANRSARTDRSRVELLVVGDGIDGAAQTPYADHAMVARAQAATKMDPESMDQRVFLFGKTFDDYESLLAIRGERSIPRIYYLAGTIELISPSLDHEAIKKLFARLVEAFAEESEIPLNAYGSWTLKRRAKERGAEPDECYILGVERKQAPDIAIEVEWTRGGLNKLEIYRRLRVREVWLWSIRRGIMVHALRGERYERIEQSEILPTVDLDEIAMLVRSEDQTATVRAYRARLKRRRRRK